MNFKNSLLSLSLLFGIGCGNDIDIPGVATTSIDCLYSINRTTFNIVCPQDNRLTWNGQRSMTCTLPPAMLRKNETTCKGPSGTPKSFPAKEFVTWTSPAPTSSIPIYTNDEKVYWEYSW